MNRVAGDYVRFEMTALDGSLSEFNAWGLLSGLVDPLGMRTTFGYEANLALTTVTSASGAVLTIAYDPHGRVASLTRPDGVVLRYGYSEAGDLVSFTDGNGNAVTYVYDDQHRMVSWADQNGTTVLTNSFDEIGRVVEQTDANGNTATIRYEEDETVTVDARGLETSYLLDGEGRTAGIVHPDGTTLSRAYGPGNTLVSDEFGSYDYDAQGNLLSARDRADRATTSSYDEANRLTSSTDADGLTTTYSYSAAGDLVEVAAPGGTDSYTYDGQHRVLSHTDGKGATESFAYTGSSPMPTSRTDFGGELWTMAYNPMRQPTAVTDPLGNLSRIVYDQAGNQVGL